jgi:hypothetical protein
MMQLRDLAAAAARVFDLKNKRLPIRPIMGCTAWLGLRYRIGVITVRQGEMSLFKYLPTSSALKSGSTPVCAANQAVQHCEGRSQELNGT